MFEVLRHPVFARLFAAQVVALVGTGLLTVALGLLAYDLASDQAGAVLGTVFAIKMVAYVGLAPLANAIAERWPRKRLLIGADLVRAAVALVLPFVDQIWQIYLLIFLLSSALAGLLLLLISYHWLFVGTVMGFAGSALLVWVTALPGRATDAAQRSFAERVTRGIRIYLATPRLRGLLALNLAAASAGAFVLVNTVVMVRAGYGAGDAQVAMALAAFGAGSMVSALALPRLLETVDDRMVMIPSAMLLAALTLGHSAYLGLEGRMAWGAFVAVWLLSGLFYSAILTPSGRLLRISAHAPDRPAVFTAQFTLSHACWLITYPVAGWVGGVFGLAPAMSILGAMALFGALAALAVWPGGEAAELDHAHPELPPGHPHLRAHPADGARHRHVFVIDDEHRAWPTHG